MSDPAILLFVTCGTSALTNLTADKDSEAGKRLSGIVSDFLDEPAKEAFAARVKLEQVAIDAHLKVFKNSDWDLQKRHYRRLPAEVVSTHALVQDLKQGGDSIGEIVILESATDEGRLSARVNCKLLHELFPKTKISTETVPGWDREFVDLTEPLLTIVSRKKEEFVQSAADVFLSD